MLAYAAQGTDLEERSLVLKDFQTLLETVNLSLTASLPLSVRLCLGNAFLLNLTKIFIDSSQLCLDIALVASQFGIGLVETSSLLGLVFDILLLGGLLNLVLLALSVIGLLCLVLSCIHLCQALLKVCLGNLKQTNDAGASTVGCPCSL